MPDYANALAGFGAGLSGQLPQFLAQQNQQKEMDQTLLLKKQEQQARAQEQQAKMQEIYTKLSAQNLVRAKELNDAGNVDGIIALSQHHAQIAQQLGQSPEDAVRIGLLAQAKKNGSEEASKLLDGEINTGLKAFYQAKILVDPNAETEATKTLKQRAAASGRKEGTPEYQDFIARNGEHVDDSTPLVKNIAQLESLKQKLSGIPEGSQDYQSVSRQIAWLEKGLAKETAPTMANAVTNMTDDSKEMAIEKVLAGDALPRAFAANPVLASEIYDLAAKKARERGMTGQEAVLNAKSIKADQTSLTNLTKQYDMITAFEGTAIKNLDMLLEQSKKVPRGDIQLVNSFILGGKRQFSDPETIKFYAILKPTLDEYAKILAGSTGSAGATDTSRREAAELITPYMSDKAITDLVPFIKRELANRTSMLEEQRQAIKGRMQGGAKPATSAPSDSNQSSPASASQINDLLKKYGGSNVSPR